MVDETESMDRDTFICRMGFLCTQIQELVLFRTADALSSGLYSVASEKLTVVLKVVERLLSEGDFDTESFF